MRGGVRGINRAEEQKDTFQLRRRLRPSVAGVVDGQLGTKRRIDVDNLTRASFERQIPCRKISDFPRKRGVPSTEKDKKEEGEREREGSRQAHPTIPCIRERARPTGMYMRK